jgi:fido (protein-threonine AMPylation protein)
MRANETDARLASSILNLSQNEQRTSYLNEHIQLATELIASQDPHQVDLGVKYLPEVFRSLKSVADSTDLNNSYTLFKPIILAVPNLNPHQKDLYIQAINDHDLSFYSAFSEQISTDQHFNTTEWLQRHAFKLLGLTPEETKNIILDNWTNVKNYFKDLQNNDSELTLSILREVSRLSSATILPSFAQGFRHDPSPVPLGNLSPVLEEIEYGHKNFPAHGAPVYELENIMPDIINQANNLIQNTDSKKRFEVSIASLAADYASAHPHPDGNGTKTLFFIETCMALRTDYPLLEEYSIDMLDRSQQFLRNNSKAVAILFSKTAINMIRSSLISHPTNS